MKVQAPKDGRQLRKRAKGPEENTGPFIFSPFASLNNASSKPNNVFGECLGYMPIVNNCVLLFLASKKFIWELVHAGSIQLTSVFCILATYLFSLLYIIYFMFPDFQWIEGDVCEVVLLFDNILTIPLQLSNIVSLLAIFSCDMRRCHCGQSAWKMQIIKTHL